MLSLKNKPIYKKFLTLKTNVQYRKRLLSFKFKKQKWQTFISFLIRFYKRRKKKFFIYDMNKDVLPRFSNQFKKKYKTILQNKKKLNLFYGGLLKKQIKKNKFMLAKNKNLYINKFNRNLAFIELFEKRLDVVLYRSHFVPTIIEARQLISHNHIKINKKVINKKSYILKPGDFISINKKLHKPILNNIYKSHFWPLPPKYLNVNYKTLEICFTDKIKSSNLSNVFPSWFNIYHTLRYN